MYKTLLLGSGLALLGVGFLSFFYLRTSVETSEIAPNAGASNSVDYTKIAPSPNYTPYVAPTLAPTPTVVPTPLPRLTAQQKQQEIAERKAQTNRILSALPRVSLGKPRLIKQWNTLPMVFDLGFSPDGSLLAVGGSNNNGGYGSGVDLRSTKNWQSKGFLGGSTRFAWAPNSRLIAVVSKGVDIWDVRAHEIIASLADGSGMDGYGNKGGAGVYGPMIFSADSSKLTTLGEDPNSRWKLLDNDTNTDASFYREIAYKVWNVADGKRLKVKPGPWSRDTNNLVRISNTPWDINFASISNGSSKVSNTTPPVYITSNSPNRRFFGRRSTPPFPYALLSISSNNGGSAIAGNAWLYAMLGRDNAGHSAIQIFRTRDQRLLQSLKLPSKRRITDIAISPDAKTLAVAQDHPTEETIKNPTYGLITREVSRSRVSIYQLNTRKH